MIAGFGSGRSTLVSPSTGLCIEAPPRSGNSFFVTGFSIANPEVVLAHHHHVPAQVLTAISLRIPIVTLLRNPVDSALAKAAPAMERFLIGTTLTRWISFWETTNGHLPLVPVVPFANLIADPSGVINRINRRFGTSFSNEFPESDQVFMEMERIRLANQGGLASDKPNPNIPDPRIANKEAMLRPEAEQHQLATPAMKLYRELLEKVSSDWPATGTS